MTRFVGESLTTRTGRHSTVVLGKDRQKYMKIFKETGKHPLIEKTREENVNDALAPLPTLDINRPHVFIDLQQNGRILGRIIVELFDDILPVHCATFSHRCLEGHHTLKHTTLHKIQPSFAVFGGLAKRAQPVIASKSKKVPNLRHTDAGLLSVHNDGSHFAMTLGRALVLDDNYQVIGRIGKGLAALSDLADIPTTLEEAPESPITIVQCGTTNHLGLNDTLSAGQAVPETAADARAATQLELRKATEGVQDALAQGLKRRLADTQEGGSKCAGASTNKQGRASKQKGAAKACMAALSSDEEDSDTSDE